MYPPSLSPDILVNLTPTERALVTVARLPPAPTTPLIQPHPELRPELPSESEEDTRRQFFLIFFNFLTFFGFYSNPFVQRAALSRVVKFGHLNLKQNLFLLFHGKQKLKLFVMEGITRLNFLKAKVDKLIKILLLFKEMVFLSHLIKFVLKKNSS